MRGVKGGCERAGYMGHSEGRFGVEGLVILHGHSEM